MRKAVIICFIIALTVVNQVNADCITNLYGKVLCGRGKCEIDQFGRAFCAQKDGGIMKDIYGNILCGVGHCAKNYMGQVWCSVEQDGSVATDSYGKVKCLGGCETGKLELCDEAQQPW